ncbi:hypothetical protein [Variovorax guangxiensis]|uniref:hypothetical protein n=1 Tax=Variovorax guangxiensis TaxID=1775474 RepID=UPI002855F394|nr:hypothetical protein [Variovorax guangxiensis]MDR6857874.1 hypothetical protein [Variovorax guangxiensis]
MQTNLPTLCFVLGAVLVLVGLLGGQFSIFSAQVQGTVGKKLRVLAFLMGVGLIAFSILKFSESSRPPPPAPTPKPDRRGDSGVGPPKKGGGAPAPTPALTDPSAEALAAMQWIGSRCGPGIKFVAAVPPGSRMDAAGRAFATAIGNSGVRPVPVLINYPGLFSPGGAFSLDKVDEWYQSQNLKDGCSLVIVPREVSTAFPAPRVNIALAGNAYSIVLPRGVVAEATSSWNAVFVKASNDPDFTREVSRSGLEVDVVRLR